MSELRKGENKCVDCGSLTDHIASLRSHPDKKEIDVYWCHCCGSLDTNKSNELL